MAHTQDDGFHEIQLNGKQLVFLFMAATVVSVVIFLLGVLVGRTVRTQRGAAVETAILDEMPPADVTATGGTASAPPQAGADPATAAPPPGGEDLSYFTRLERDQQGRENLKPLPAPEAEKPAPPPAAPPRTSGAAAWVVQIAALNALNEATAMAKRVSSNGYQAYVEEPATGSPNIYRVRVGPFKTKREADSTASKIQKELQLDPWVTRP